MRKNMEPQIYKFENHSHTLGNLFQYYLNQDPAVSFVSYTILNTMVRTVELAVAIHDANSASTVFKNAAETIREHVKMLRLK
jgi:DNA-directed RNA polymerase subunit L